MTGHVFHPGHEELHGVTVVIEATAGRTFVGRYHDTEAGRLRLHDVAVHDASASERTREEFLARIARFGVPPEHKFIAVPAAEVERMTPLRDLAL